MEQKIEDTINEMLENPSSTRNINDKDIDALNLNFGSITNPSQASERGSERKFENNLKSEMNCLQNKLRTDFAKEIGNIEVSKILLDLSKKKLPILKDAIFFVTKTLLSCKFATYTNAKWLYYI